ncbi:hypothetical protein D3C84_776860 [compost metagenome]
MDKAHGRRIACRQHGRFGDAVEAGGGRRQTAVGDIRRIPLLAVVIARAPVHAVLLGQQLVGFTHPRAFDAAQLLDAALGRRRLLEAQFVHLAHHLQAQLIVQRKLGLVQQTVGPRPARLTAGIQAHPGLADPYQQGAYGGGQVYRGMGHPRTGLEHDAGHRTDRDMHAHAGLVDHHEGAVLHIDLPVLDKNHRHPILHRQGF